MFIRKGTIEDAARISELYDDLCDYLEAGTNYPGWKKGIYPTIEDAMRGINLDCMYVAIQEDRIVGSIILNHIPEEAYYSVNWRRELPYEKIMVIHTFAVHPDFMKKGIGSKLLIFADYLAKKEGMESIRLDVGVDNLPAQQLYEKHGYEFVEKVDLGYGEYGLPWFNLYEKML